MIFINSTSTVRIHQRTNHSSIDGGKGAWIDFDNDPVRLTFISQVGYVQVIQCTKLTLITKYWLVSGTDSSVILLKYRQNQNQSKIKTLYTCPYLCFCLYKLEDLLFILVCSKASDGFQCHW